MKHNNNPQNSTLTRLAVFAAALVLAAAASAWDGYNYNYQRLKSFGIPNTGLNPWAGVIEGQDGSLYGTTYSGGNANLGTVYRVRKDGSGMTVLHHFDNTTGNGANPVGGLVQDANGVLYGTTYSGGQNGFGIVFSVKTNGTDFTVLHHFGSGSDGRYPYASLILDSGVLYGTTQNGGGVDDVGTVFKINTDGTGYTVLHSFTSGGSDGNNPQSPLWLSGGVLYGTTSSGGANGLGTVFKIGTNGTGYTVLKDFGGFAGDSETPVAGVMEDQYGVLYGTAYQGGDYTYGTIYRLDKDGNNYSVVYSFGGTGTDAVNPSAALVQGSDGTLYGTTYGGGSSGYGTVFKIGTNGTGYVILRNFANNNVDGHNLASSVLIASDGKLYGTANSGGGYGSYGALYTLDTSGANYATLFSFSTTGGDALSPEATVLASADGFLYGTTFSGGAANGGTIFKVKPDGTEYTILRQFSSADTHGYNPNAGLIQIDDYLYGTTRNGSGVNRFGTVFKISTNGTGFTTLRRFGTISTEGRNPEGPLMLGQDGLLYGTTLNSGAANGVGSVFRIATNGSSYSVVKTFNSTVSTDGQMPRGMLVQDGSGNIYGATVAGGTSGFGVIYKIDTSLAYSTIYNFTGGTGDGKYVHGGLLLGSDGNLYGATRAGGANDSGVVFKCTTGGSYSVLYHLGTGTAPQNPLGALIEMPDSYIYGTTTNGGANGVGAIFRLKTDGTMFTNFYSFATTGGDGQRPKVGLSKSGTTLFGTTYQGGDMGYGTIFMLYNTAPTISGEVANQPVNDNATVACLSTVTVTDPDNQSMDATVTIVNGVNRGDFTPGSSTGWTRTVVGNDIQYTRHFPASANIGAVVTTAIQALIFQPRQNAITPGTTENTTFTVSVDDSFGVVANGSPISTITTSINDPPTIGGTAPRFVNDNSTVVAFPGVTLTDVDNPPQTQTVTVTPDDPAKGWFTPASLTASGFSSNNGVYTFTGTASAAQTAIRTLVFAPVPNRVPATDTEVTTFTITINDGSGDVSNNGATVTSTSVNDPPVIDQGASVSVTMERNGWPTAFSLSLSATDVDPGHNLIWTVDSAPAHGVATATSPGDTSTIGYTPTFNYTGTDSFVIKVTDEIGATDTITVNVTINERAQPTITYVDDSYAGYTNETEVTWPQGQGGPVHRIGYDAFTNIQQAIDAVTAAGTVNVANGTYVLAAPVNVSKAVTLTGESQAGVVVNANNASTDGFVVSSAGVTIEKFTVHNATQNGVKVTSSGEAIIRNNTLTPNTPVGILVDGGKARIENNDLTGNTTAAIVVQNGATVDAGDCTGSNVTGLGSSAGGNLLTGYGFDNAAPWAIQNLNTSGQPDVMALQNSFGAVAGDDIGKLISSANTAVKFSQTGGLLLSAPSPVTVQCVSGVPSAATTRAQFLAIGGMVSASEVTISSVDGPLTPGPYEGTITRTYTLTDSCGNSASIAQTITVDDTQAPVITGCPANIVQNNDSGLCSAVVTWTAPVANDNCGMASFTSTHNPGDTFPKGVTTVIYTATDTAGNTSVCSFTVTVNDAEAPVITCNSSISLTYTGMTITLAPVDVLASYSDNCTPQNQAVMSLSQSIFGCADIGSKSVTLTVTDQSGNTATCSTTVTVIQGTIGKPPNVYVDKSWTGKSTCEIVNFPGGPNGLEFNYTAFSNIQSAVAAVAPGGTIHVADGTYILSAQVSVTNSVRILGQSPDTTIIDANYVLHAFNVTTNNVKIEKFRIIKTALAGIKVSATGSATIRSNKINYLNPYGIFVTGGKALVEYNDLSGNDTSAIRIENNGIVDAGDCTGANITGLGTGSGPNGSSAGGNNLSGYGFDATSPWAIQNLNSSGKSPAYALNNSFGAIVGTDIRKVFDAPNNIVIYSQSGGLLVKAPTNLTVSCGGLLPPAASTWQQFVAQGGMLSASNVASITSVDVQNPDPLNGQDGTVTRTYTVTDLCGNTGSAVQIITVDDTTPPTITQCASSHTINVGGSCQATVPDYTSEVVAADSCSSSVNKSQNPAPGTLLGPGNYTVTFYVDDGNGNTNTCTSSLTVQDVTPPTITAPANVTVNADPGQCYATGVALGTPTTGDNCSVASVVNNAPPQFPVGTTTVTWTVTDASGNTAQATQTVTVVDGEAPTVVCKNITIQYVGPPTVIQPTNVLLSYSDNCTAQGQATFSLSQDTFYCADINGTFNVTLTATDQAGNTATCSAQVTVQDGRTAPAVAYVDDDWVGSVSCQMVSFPGGPNNLEFNYNAFTNIQDAIDAVVSGGTVYVANGYYDLIGQIDINKPLTIIGQSRTGTYVDAFYQLAGFYVNASGVTIANFRIENAVVAGILLDNLASATIRSNDINYGASYGIQMVGATAIIEYNNLSSNLAAGLRVQGGAIADAGDCSGLNITGLGTGTGPNGSSAGFNVLSGYGFDNAQPWAIQNLNSLPEPGVMALNNYYGAVVGDDIRKLLVPGATGIKFSQAGGLLVQPPTNQTVQCVADVPGTASTSLAQFLADGGMVSASEVTVSHIDGPLVPGPAEGTVTRTYTLTDSCGVTAQAIQVITVDDTIFPVITGCPANISLSTSPTQCSAVVSWTPPTATDNCGVTLTSTHNPGDTFPVGTTVVVYTAADPAGNTTTCSFTVTVQDLTPPTITAPSNVTVNEDAGQCYASGVNLGTPITSDNCSVASVVNNAPPQFPLGTTVVTWTVTDASGNTAQATQTVTVNEVNDAPAASNDSKVADEDTPLVFPASDLLANDNPGGGACESWQTLTVVGVVTPTAKGGTVLLAGGNIYYTPAPNYNSLIDGDDSFTYTVQDNGTTGGMPDPKTSTATVVIQVREVNDAPTAVNQNLGPTPEDTPFLISSNSLLAGALRGPVTATDESTQVLQISWVSSNSTRRGTVIITNGNVLYRPATNFNGVDTFFYALTDNGTTAGSPDPKSATGMVTVVVSPVQEVFPSYFTALQNYLTGPGPNSVAVGYFGGPYPYLVVANYNTNYISVLSGDGNGSFASLVTNITVGNTPAAVVVADFNGDTYEDIAVANDTDNNVTIIFGDGMGGFVVGASYPVGTNAIHLAVGDFNHDANGRPDLAVVSYVENSVKVLLNNGDGTFGAASSYAVGSNPVFVAVADMNNDTYADLVVANYNSNTVSVLLNTANGSGTFLAQQSFAVGAKPLGVAVGDVNGDNKVDVVTADSADNTATVLLGNGAGAITFFTNYFVGMGPSAVLLADLKGSNRLDLVVANELDDTVWVLPGTGTGAFANYYNEEATLFTVGDQPVALAKGQFNPNNDVYLDLAVANFASSNITVLLNSTHVMAYSSNYTIIEDSGSINATMGGWGSPLMFQVIQNPTRGALSGTPPMVVYTPYTNEFGSDSYKFRVTDGSGAYATNTVYITILPKNDPPSFSMSTNLVVVAEDKPKQYFYKFLTNLTVGPPNEAGQTFSFITDNDNTNLFSSQPMVNSAGTLVFQAKPNAYGDALCTVVMKDSGGTAYGGNDTSEPAYFVISITNVNDAPTVLPATFASKTIYEDKQTNYVFTITDLESDPDDLDITVTSTNLTLVPEDFLNNIIITRNGSNINVTVRPMPDEFGKTLLTFSISDGTNTTTRTSLLTVYAVNDQPEFEVTDTVINWSIANDGKYYSNLLVAAYSLGPPNESTQMIQSYTVTASPNTMFYTQPKIILTNGYLFFTLKGGTNVGTSTLTITLTDNGGTYYGGTNKSAPKIVTVNINP